MSSEVRLKHLELIFRATRRRPRGRAIRVSWPASLYAHDVTHGEQRAARRRGSTCTRRSRSRPTVSLGGTTRRRGGVAWPPRATS